jgi:LacI family transcriptional regulator
VARHAGVSPATVSNLLNGKGRLGDETRGRIRAAMEELHFTPNGLIRALQQRRTNVIGLLVGGFRALLSENADPVTAPVLAGVYDAADLAQQDILLYTGWPDRPERSSGHDFLDGRVDGLIWVAPPVGSSGMEKLARAGLPVVAALTRRVPENVGYVDTENVDGGRQVTAHLITQGHTRIAVAAPTHASNFLDRLEGYRAALTAAGIPYEPVLAATDPALADHPDDPRTYARILDRWMALPHPPTAVFASTDRWAARLAEAAQARGLSIPGDLALAGFDDTVAARTLCGGLTSVSQPFMDIGRMAVEQLLRTVGAAPAAACRVALPVTLTVRASTLKTH